MKMIFFTGFLEIGKFAKVYMQDSLALETRILKLNI